MTARQKAGRSRSGRATAAARSNPQAVSSIAGIPSADDAIGDGLWHLVCITNKGMVSILKNLDLLSARETYKALLPGTKPKIYQQVPCTRPRASGMIRGASMGWSSIDPDRDYLKRIEPLGPAGAKLDPWHGVEPDLVKVFCECGCRWERRTETPEEKEDRRLRELGEAVPTAFWLKDPAHA